MECSNSTSEVPVGSTNTIKSGYRLNKVQVFGRPNGQISVPLPLITCHPLVARSAAAPAPQCISEVSVAPLAAADFWTALVGRGQEQADTGHQVAHEDFASAFVLKNARLSSARRLNRPPTGSHKPERAWLSSVTTAFTHPHCLKRNIRLPFLPTSLTNCFRSCSVSCTIKNACLAFLF